jgi:hypothetical protein
MKAELHFEGQRRTDLIRFVNSQEEVIYGHGKVGCWISNTPFRDLFPIPA